MRPKESFRIDEGEGGIVPTRTPTIVIPPTAVPPANVIAARLEYQALTVEEPQVKAEITKATEQLNAAQKNYNSVRDLYNIEVTELNRLKSEYASRFPT